MCDSTYTINRKTGEKLFCQRHFNGGWSRGEVHSAHYGGLDWTWSNQEANK